MLICSSFAFAGDKMCTSSVQCDSDLSCDNIESGKSHEKSFYDFSNFTFT